MNLRRPDEKLADCMWLPRFVDKVRHHFAGTLRADYQRAFCSPHGIDGVFLVHFRLSKEEAIEAIRRHDSDSAVAAWFVARPEAGPASITAWNALAPHIGRPGYPAHRTFQWGLKNLYGGCADPRVDSGFTAIAWDEGFLDEVWGYEPYTSGTASRTT